MRFAIYIPGDGVANPDKLVKAGLPNMLANATAMATSAGPDGKSGVVFFWPVADPRSFMTFLSHDVQTWLPAVERDGLPAGRYWLGFYKDNPPTPDDLAYGRLEGVRVELGGHSWVMPAAGALPSNIVIGDDWQVHYQLKPEYSEIYQDAQRWADWLKTLDADSGGGRCSDEVYTFLAKMLNLNYHVPVELINHMGLFTPETILRCVIATSTGLVCSADEGAVSNG